MQLSGGVLTDVTAVFYPSPTPTCSARSHELRHLHAFSDSRSLPSLGFLKSYPFSMVKSGVVSSRRTNCIAKASGSSGHDLAPLQLESPVGQLLEQILHTHPHLLASTIDQQLQNLQNERDAQKDETPPSSMDLSLYKRIAQVKEKDRHKVLEEIMYCWIVHQFVDKEITMIPKVSSSSTTSDPTGRVDFWPNQEMKLESVHSPEALEMIQNHVALVIGDRVVGPLESIVQISKIKLGKLYAASIMYGYFLKRVDERFQLERSMNTLPEGFKEQQKPPESPFWDPDSLIRIQPDYDIEEEGFMGGGDDDKGYRLRSYVMYLDAETLQRYATIRSKEAISLIEKQTQALFGRPDIKVSEDGSLGASNDEVVNLTFSGLTMLVLEAVAFGSFLWDAENYVESKYPFLKS